MAEQLPLTDPITTFQPNDYEIHEQYPTFRRIFKYDRPIQRSSNSISPASVVDQTEEIQELEVPQNQSADRSQAANLDVHHQNLFNFVAPSQVVNNDMDHLISTTDHRGLFDFVAPYRQANLNTGHQNLFDVVTPSLLETIDDQSLFNLVALSRPANSNIDHWNLNRQQVPHYQNYSSQAANLIFDHCSLFDFVDPSHAANMKIDQRNFNQQQVPQSNLAQPQVADFMIDPRKLFGVVAPSQEVDRKIDHRNFFNNVAPLQIVNKNSDRPNLNQQQQVPHFQNLAQSQAANLNISHRNFFSYVAPLQTGNTKSHHPSLNQQQQVPQFQNLTQSQAANLNNIDRRKLFDQVAPAKAVNMTFDHRDLFTQPQVVNTEIHHSNLKAQSHKPAPTTRVTLTPVWDLLESLSEDQVMEIMQVLNMLPDFDVDTSDSVAKRRRRD